MSVVTEVCALVPERVRDAQRGQSNEACSPALECRRVAKRYRSGSQQVEVLRDIDLQIAPGEMVAVLGYSGTGKTTLAKLLAGLESPTAGQVLMDGQPVRGADLTRGYMFQNYSLLPWMTVLGNVQLAVDQAFPQWPKSRRREHALQYIEMVGLGHAYKRLPSELSGGMRQRTSLARTLSTLPRVLILDEPLSALDALTRGVLQQEILRIWSEFRQACVLITNDIDEAILMADRIVPLTIGPAATLGPAFTVDIERPRTARELNRNPQYKELRNEIVAYLLQQRQRSQQSQPTAKLPRPDCRPQSLHPPSYAIFGSRWPGSQGS